MSARSIAGRTVLVLALAPVMFAACQKDPAPAPVGATSAAVSLSVPEPNSAAPVASSSAPPASSVSREGCPADMIRVEGDYCPEVDERCMAHTGEWEKDHDKSEICLKFESPTRCLSKERKHVAFCVDEYEWPNKVGELPWVLVNWLDAGKMCAGIGKRLCTEDEFNFACEGPEMLPYVWGYDRAESTCNIDKPYRERKGKFRHYEKCLANPKCKEALDKIDQREKIGERTTCLSWAGIHDLNGNVNEWVNLPGKEPPDRSGLKGGWWGPVRNRCRPTVTFHKEEDYGYEAGFRCCGDTK